MAAEIRANTPVRTRGAAVVDYLFDRWGRPAFSRGVALSNPEDSTDGNVISVRLEDGSVLPYCVDDLEPAPPEQPERGPLAGAADADVAREFWRRFEPVKVLVGQWEHGALTYAEESGDGKWQSGLSEREPQNEEHAAGVDGFVAAIERARDLAGRRGACDRGGDRARL